VEEVLLLMQGKEGDYAAMVLGTEVV